MVFRDPGNEAGLRRVTGKSWPSFGEKLGIFPELLETSGTYLSELGDSMKNIMVIRGRFGKNITLCSYIHQKLYYMVPDF